ncbi:hypothetical protein [Catenuloplanes japonicus]|uniref:hypothetical protein n=1 Tax=Catenuloplanes japonicus TaxID=33876 RepID=UPI00068E94AD|nr:hypothetical protein [Catenuloplanes japonicus]
MGELVPLPRRGEIFSDVRGDSRVMRVSCHDESDMVVLSLWVDRHCRASFRLLGEDVPRLMETLGSLNAAAPAQRLDPARPDPADVLSWEPSELSVSAESAIGLAPEPPAPPMPLTGAFDVVVRPISPAPRDPGQFPPAAAG